MLFLSFPDVSCRFSRSRPTKSNQTPLRSHVSSSPTSRVMPWRSSVVSATWPTKSLVHWEFLRFFFGMFDLEKVLQVLFEMSKSREKFRRTPHLIIFDPFVC